MWLHACAAWSDTSVPVLRMVTCLAACARAMCPHVCACVCGPCVVQGPAEPEGGGERDAAGGAPVAPAQQAGHGGRGARPSTLVRPVQRACRRGRRRSGRVGRGAGGCTAVRDDCKSAAGSGRARVARAPWRPSVPRRVRGRRGARRGGCPGAGADAKAQILEVLY